MCIRDSLEVIGHQALVARQQLCLGIELTLQAGGDLNGLHITLEGARKDAVDGAFELLLNPVKQPHVCPSHLASVHDPSAHGLSRRSHRIPIGSLPGVSKR